MRGIEPNEKGPWLVFYLLAAVELEHGECVWQNSLICMGGVLRQRWYEFRFMHTLRGRVSATGARGVVGACVLAHERTVVGNEK